MIDFKQPDLAASDDGSTADAGGRGATFQDQELTLALANSRTRIERSLKKAGDNADVDDILQHSALKVLFDGLGARFENLEDRITYVGISMARAFRQSVPNTRTQYSPDLESLAAENFKFSPIPDPYDTVICSELSDQIYAAMITLKPSYREVLRLRETEQLSYEEISKMLGLPYGTVCNRVSRARAAFIGALIENGGDEKTASSISSLLKDNTARSPRGATPKQ